MSERVIDRIGGIADQLREQAWEAERLGQLPDETVKMLKSAGNIRLLQPKTHGGYEVHPREFVETVNHLQRLPQWKDTAAVIAYDDSDGWYDHKPSPLVMPSKSQYDALNGDGTCGTGGVPATYQGRCGFGPGCRCWSSRPTRRRITSTTR